jgi:aromatic ring-opening dioxygenase LigB subunit
MISFAAICPHPPILLPSVGSKEDRKKLKKTLDALAVLAKIFKRVKPEKIIISSPHPDWGFNVPLFFLVKDFKGEIEEYLTDFELPEFYFETGKKLYKTKIKNSKSKIALIASGDLSHCLSPDGPYGFHPDGPKFDKALIEFLKKKDIKNILGLDKAFPGAGECGLRSFCFLLGVLEEAKINWQSEILSYQGPFGVGYLVANFKIPGTL